MTGCAKNQQINHYEKKKTFTNHELEVELTSYIDNKQNIRFKGKYIAQILGYSNTDQALRKNIDPEIKNLFRPKRRVIPKAGGDLQYS